MPKKEYHRTQRVADLLQQELSRVLKKEIQDPRLQWVTISGVEVSRDLAHAKILITPAASWAHETEKTPRRIEDVLKVLNKASGFLRRELASSLDLRVTPHLHFVHDASIEHGAKMTSLINDAIARDKTSNKESE